MTVIRTAVPRNAAAIDRILRVTFPRPNEARLVQQLAIDGDLVLVLVAEEDSGELSGLVALSRMDVQVGGQNVPCVALAPLAVLPEYRQTGVAERLVEASIAWMRDAGAALAFVLGEPGYYGRFGFDPAMAEGFASPYAGPFLLALPLQGVMPAGERGVAAHASAFAALSQGADDDGGAA